MKIYLKNNPEFQSVRDLMIWYFENDCPETYNEDNSIQCYMGKRRSFEDLLDLSNTYFEVTPKELIKTLNDISINERDLNSKMKKPTLISIYCRDICRNVFLVLDDNYNAFIPYMGTVFHSDSFMDDRGTGRYTKQELINLIKEE